MFLEKLSVIVLRRRYKLEFVEIKFADGGPYLKVSYLCLLLFPQEGQV